MFSKESADLGSGNLGTGAIWGGSGWRISSRGKGVLPPAADGKEEGSGAVARGVCFARRGGFRRTVVGGRGDEAGGSSMALSFSAMGIFLGFEGSFGLLGFKDSRCVWAGVGRSGVGW